MTICADRDPVKGLIDFVLDIKPYHTKIIEVLVEYIYSDPLNVSITDNIAFDIELNLGTTKPGFICDVGFGSVSYNAHNLFPDECIESTDGFFTSSITDDISFELGMDLFFYDNITAYIEDYTDDGTYSSSGIGRALAGGYGHMYGGVTDPKLFIAITDTVDDLLNVTITETVYTPFEIIFNQDGGTNTTLTETKFTESIYFHTEILLLTDNIGTIITEYIIPTDSLGSFVGAFDYPGFDLGGFDEDLEP